MATETSSQPSLSAEPISKVETAEQELPKLSADDFKVFNKQAVMMEYYHNHFRHSWRQLYAAVENNSRPKNMSLNQFMNIGLQLCHHLTIHHDIEERHIFPVLAQRMTEFSHSPSASDPRARLMVLQHKQIHAGLDDLEKYLNDCKRGVEDFKLNGDGSLKEIMDGFGEVLWTHLNEEVRLLGAENMRKYWTKHEMHNMNW